MQFSCSFWSVQLNWIYLVVGRSPATSNSIALYMFMHKISTRVVCVNGKHPCNTLSLLRDDMKRTWLLTSIKGLYLYSLFVNCHYFHLSIKVASSTKKKILNFSSVFFENTKSNVL